MSKNFVDKAKIYVQGGKGGRGSCSFRREKFVPMGGPDGGDGGKGGDIILVASENCSTLLDFKHRAHFKAQPGMYGRSANKNGAKGKDLRLPVPVGTLVYTAEDDRLIADLNTHGAEFIVAKGGRGGRGNVHFLTETNNGPRDHELGEPGEERWVRLELRVVAQVGIIGFPNVGKSTLLASVTNAKPAIADYPFTTLSPVLGVWERNFRRLVFADIPGLIEGAAEGAGLGHDFLRHISRTRVLLHIISLAEVDKDEPLAKYDQIRRELEAYDPALKERPEVLAVNKVELFDKAEELEALRRVCRERGLKLHEVSCFARSGLDELMLDVFEAVQKSPDLPEFTVEPEKIYAPEDFTVSKEEDGWHVDGVRVNKAVLMTNLDEDESVNRLQRRFNAWGVEDRLAEAGAKPGDPVFIAGHEFSYDPAPVWADEIDLDEEPDVRPSQKVRLENKTAVKRQSLAGLAGLRGRGKRRS
ncbi:GTPase ObgE [bacterium]|nr:GTPase ObgE [bacterium]